MNPFAMPARLWPYLLSLELSEYLGGLPRRRANRRALDHFVDEEWRLVHRLDRFSRAQTNRQLPALQSDVAALKARVDGLSLDEEGSRFVGEKLGSIEAALRAAICAPPPASGYLN